MSKKNTILEDYNKARAAAFGKARYYKQRYGIEIKVPPKPKKPTRASIDRLNAKVNIQVQEAKKEVRKKRFKEQNAKKRAKKKPDLGAILKKRIMGIIEEGFMYGAFEGYKADEVAHQISLATPSEPEAANEFWLSMAEKIPKLDEVIEKFIFASEQSTDTSRGKSDYCYTMMMSILFDIPLNSIDIVQDDWHEPDPMEYRYEPDKEDWERMMDEDDWYYDEDEDEDEDDSDEDEE